MRVLDRSSKLRATYGTRNDRRTNMLKRLVNLSASALGLTVLSPVLVAIAVIVRCGAGPPVFFTQTRLGRGGKAFRLVKFRTMTDQRDKQGSVLADERRITPVGRTLRRFRLDELPELYSVLIGDMNFVGPRPLPPGYTDSFGTLHTRRLEVRPGLTGWAQVSGNTLLTIDEKAALDAWYVDHQSLFLDATILVQTARVVIFGEKVRSDRVEAAQAYAHRLGWLG
jgi:lipopolysaccharide/colanic/teichoic acid biosynthesis glycosyltransferase